MSTAAIVTFLLFKIAQGVLAFSRTQALRAPALDLSLAERRLWVYNTPLAFLARATVLGMSLNGIAFVIRAWFTMGWLGAITLWSGGMVLDCASVTFARYIFPRAADPVGIDGREPPPIDSRSFGNIMPLVPFAFLLGVPLAVVMWFV